MKKRNKFELTSIISLFKENKKAKDIAKILNISNSNLSYYVGKLRKQGILKYKGNGIWLVQKSVPTPLPKKTHFVRGHAFIWKIEYNKHLDWESKLIKKRIRFKKQSSGKVLRIIFNKRKIWLKEKGIIIYEPFDYFGDNSYQAKGKAVFYLDKLLKELFDKLGMNLISYKFTTSREHFALLKNELARQYNDKGEKMHIRSSEGTEWLWIDDSHGFNELETNEMNVNKQVQDYWNDQKKHKFQVTPSFLMESIGGLVQTQQMNANNIIKHQNVLDEMLITLKSIQTSLTK